MNISATTAHKSSATGEPSVAVLADVWKTYGEVVALAGVDLEIGSGEILGLLGPNGAGKTTTVNLLLGLTRPDAGTIRVFDAAPHDSRSRRRVGAMLQISAVPHTLKIRELIDSFSAYYPDPLPPEQVLQIAGLEGLEDRLFGKLSGGQRQRALLALAVCGDPDLLYLDEPTAGLDVEARRSLWRQIRSLADRGRSVVLTTHYLEEADALADRIHVLNRGRTIATGTPDEIKSRVQGRRIRCRTRLHTFELKGIPGISSVSESDGFCEILTPRAEPVLRELLQRDPHLADLEVHGAALDEAFLALTQQSNEKTPTSRPQEAA